MNNKINQGNCIKYKGCIDQVIHTLLEVFEPNVLVAINGKKYDYIVISKKKIVLYEKHKGRYCVDRIIHALFNDYSLKVNHKHVYRVMKELNCLAFIKANFIKAKKSFKQTTSKHSGINLFNRNFNASFPFDKLATDINYSKNA
ncbi:IS3 family transposase [Terrisporobacter glycolicus]|uniref:IS3 family transposase n=1 Tax=Terrisporobacter glycolicus TaxID=36841 RepID=UPI0034648D3B